MVELLLRFYPGAARLTDNKGSSVAHLACENYLTQGYYILKAVLEACGDEVAKSSDRDGNYLIHKCARERTDVRPELLRFVLDFHPDAVQKFTKAGESVAILIGVFSNAA